MKKTWFLWLMPLLVLTGCGERYRYPCQDPENWNEKYGDAFVWTAQEKALMQQLKEKNT